MLFINYLNFKLKITDIDFNIKKKKIAKSVLSFLILGITLFQNHIPRLKNPNSHTK